MLNLTLLWTAVHFVTKTTAPLMWWSDHN